MSDLLPPGWSFGRLAITVVLVAAVCALVLLALRVFQIPIPSWAIQALWIVVVAVVIIGLIHLLMRWSNQS